MYISGMPGSGKTAITLDVVEKMKKDENFTFCQISAIKDKANDVYKELYQHILSIKPKSTFVAQIFLEDYFKTY